MATLGTALPGALAPGRIAARSRRELDRTLAHDGELTIARPSAEAVLVGAFQRGAGIDAKHTLFRRGSGGAAVRVGPGTLWVSLALARPNALVACDAAKLVNRYVRPLLRALGKVGVPARYFGRDWIGVANRPVAAVGFAHDGATGRAHVEAFVAVRTPFALGPRGSFLGKSPATLEDIIGETVDLDVLSRWIEEAYAGAYASEPLPVALDDVREDDEDVRADPPWRATVEEAIGEIGAGPDAAGLFRVGGDLLASRDAIALLESRIEGATEVDVPVIVDTVLAASGVAIDGVRSLESVAKVILAARAAS
jgi:hypothetical protein